MNYRTARQREWPGSNITSWNRTRCKTKLARSWNPLTDWPALRQAAVTDTLWNIQSDQLSTRQNLSMVWHLRGISMES
jgi:hypothetical protein